MIENLEAQIRERKAVDVILDHAEFEDVPLAASTSSDVEALNRSVCGNSAQDVDAEEHDHDHDHGDHDHDHN
jgi:trigger factor